jgi:hypothetical protein
MLPQVFWTEKLWASFYLELSITGTKSEGLEVMEMVEVAPDTGVVMGLYVWNHGMLILGILVEAVKWKRRAAPIVWKDL